MNRSLASIDSELRRRQQLFNEARDSLGESTVDIYKYQKFFKEGKVTEPVPHLFIISDEFAELKSQQPEFMDQLIQAARIGRSLGVHLILATQKPSGVVNDQIWSNTKFRVCLKVADTGDSNEIIKCPDAAEIKNAGRFYLQVGANEIFVLGQSGWAGAQYTPSDEIKKDYDRSISFIDDSGQVIKNISDESGKKKVSAQGDELSNVLKYITTLAGKENLRVENLWLDAIPGERFLEDIVKKYNFQSDVPTAIIGEYDDPSGQKQDILTLPLDVESNTIIYVLSANAREMFLREVIYSASSLYPSDKINFYIFDFGSETFKIFTRLPHVGDVVFASEQDKIGKLFKLIQDEINNRKQLFVDYNGDYNNYCKNSGNQIPLIMVIINNFESLRESYSAYEELLLVLAREGKRYGINFMIATSSRSGMYSRFLKNFENTFVLDMNSKDEYTDILGKVGNVLPAEKLGRGLFKKEIAYEYQTARFCEDDKIVEFIKEKAVELDAANPYKAKKIPILPEVVTLESISTAPFVPKEMPIGINNDSLDLVKYNFLADKAMVISGNDFETIVPFTNSLLCLFKKAGKIVTVVFDFLGEFEVGKKYAGSYANSNFEAFGKNIIKFAESKIVGQEFYLMLFINGVDKYNSDMPTEVTDKLNELVDKNNNIKLIFFDGVFGLKKILFEPFFQDFVIPSNGIWVGNGVSEQSILKVATYSKQHTANISNSFGWVFKGGNIVLTKLLDCEGETDEKQDTN
jgi:S-DNA-T family DNA segregation ATPase FtsK/SpoIIIE